MSNAIDVYVNGTVGQVQVFSLSLLSLHSRIASSQKRCESVYPCLSIA